MYINQHVANVHSAALGETTTYVDVVSFVGGFVGDCAVRIHHVDSVVSPRATE